jgi:hypothetical protein
MTLPYLTIPFSFTSHTLDWVKVQATKVFEKYQQESVNEGGLVSLTFEQQALWYTSKAWTEICEHMAPFNFEQPYDLQFFVYKKGPDRTDIRGNPHFDMLEYQSGSTEFKIVPYRFNILVNGVEEQEMVWWNIKHTDPRIEPSRFASHYEPSASMYRLQAKGDTIPSRWETVGEPTWRNNSLTKYNQWASFVRTEVCHGINWTRGSNPRFLISVRFKDTWDKVESMREKYPESQVKKIGS